MIKLLDRKLWLGLMVIVGLTLSLVNPLISIAQSVPTKPLREIRGVWITNVDSDVLFTRDRLATAIKDLRALNFNTIYPVVWNWGYTTYPSKVAKQTVGVRFRLINIPADFLGMKLLPTICLATLLG